MPGQPAVLELVADLVRAGRVFVLSGAGLSTDSGIPDYRSVDGVRRVQPMLYAEFVGSSAARQRYWARSFIGWERFRAATPNDGHRVVTRLQQRGFLRAVVTQNVDGLHQLAGADPVVELHGSLAHVVCLSCGTRVRRADVQRELSATNPRFAEHLVRILPDGSQVSSQIRPDGDIVLPEDAVGGFVPPHCPDCGSDSLKPDVVFFGESVPRGRVDACVAALEDSRSVLVLGSSLAVMSGYRFVRRAAQLELPVAVLTRGPTRGDAETTIKVDGPITPALLELAARLT
ncbi:MAG: NAD-dependent protein deacetylase 1 [Actinomycetales bacterium]|nr:MAG: NAD-dependent protein deacetylase 1 [Actinomycetales bacterium]